MVASSVDAMAVHWGLGSVGWLVAVKVDELAALKVQTMAVLKAVAMVAAMAEWMAV